MTTLDTSSPSFPRSLRDEKRSFSQSSKKISGQGPIPAQIRNVSNENLNSKMKLKVPRSSSNSPPHINSNSSNHPIHSELEGLSGTTKTSSKTKNSFNKNSSKAGRGRVSRDIPALHLNQSSNPATPNPSCFGGSNFRTPSFENLSSNYWISQDERDYYQVIQENQVNYQTLLHLQTQSRSPPHLIAPENIVVSEESKQSIPSTYYQVPKSPIVVPSIHSPDYFLPNPMIPVPYYAIPFVDYRPVGNQETPPKENNNMPTTPAGVPPFPAVYPGFPPHHPHAGMMPHSPDHAHMVGHYHNMAMLPNHHPSQQPPPPPAAAASMFTGSPVAPETPQFGPGPPIVTGTRLKGPRGCNLFVFHLPNEITNW
jgi:hypothetical protein